jgi:predicted  nucleic acid-binding Zn-ribbon protein
MLGFTFFGGSQATDMFTDDQLQETESQETQDDLSAFQERIDQMEAAPPQEQPQDMQEYVRLKSKMDEMNQEINQKEAEISSLRNTLADKQDNVDNLQTQLTSTPMTSASFSRGYEEALSKFYGKRYAETIQQFNRLAAQFPDHPRISNCVY